MIRTNRNISVAEIEKALGVSSSTIKRDMDKLKAAGKLQRSGSNKSGYWVLSNSHE